MKKLGIIGASYLQEPLIQKAKSKGIETHVFAWAANDVGEKSADYFYPISITEDENNAPVGIIVDSVKEVVTLPTSSIESANKNSKKTQVTFLSGIGKFENRLISLLDLNAVIAEDAV